MTSALIDAGGLQQLVSVLIDRGYRVVGPTVSDNAIVLAELTSADDLPSGWGVDVGPGHYRLRRRDDDALFGHSAGPQSWKQFLHPPRQKVWSSDGMDPEEPPRYAFLGVTGLRSGGHRRARRCTRREHTSRSRLRGSIATDLRGRRQLHRTGWPVLLRVDGDRSGRWSRLRPGADRTHRRRWPAVCRGRRQRRRRRRAGRAAAT